jgi:hypothetical protein
MSKRVTLVVDVPEDAQVNVDTHPTPPLTTSGKPKGAMSRKRTGEVVRQITLYLPPDPERKLKVPAVKENRLASDVVTEALVEYFARRSL